MPHTTSSSPAGSARSITTTTESIRPAIRSRKSDYSPIRLIGRFAGYADGDRRHGSPGSVSNRPCATSTTCCAPNYRPAIRRDKVLCGGHSLGGAITGYFAQWDFDGDPTTVDDADSPSAPDISRSTRSSHRARRGPTCPG